MPADPFNVGSDASEPVGEYAAPFPFAGEIKSVTIELGDTAAKRQTAP
jgi:hypothetical protein